MAFVMSRRHKLWFATYDVVNMVHTVLSSHHDVTNVHTSYVLS